MKRILATLSLIASTIFGADISQDVESNTPTAQDKDIQVYVADQGTIAINFYTNGIARPIATNDVVYFWYATNELFSTHTADLVNTGSSVFAFNDTYFPQPTPTRKPWTWGAGVNGKGFGNGNLRILRNPFHESGQLGLTNKIDWAKYEEHENIGEFPLYGCNNMSVTNNGSELFICFTGGTGATAYATEAYVDAGDAATLVSANAYTDAGDAAVSNYVDTAVADYLPLAGGTMTGDLNMGYNSITNVHRIWSHDLIAEDVAVGGTLEVYEEAEFYGGLTIHSGNLSVAGEVNVIGSEVGLFTSTLENTSDGIASVVGALQIVKNNLGYWGGIGMTSTGSTIQAGSLINTFQIYNQGYGNTLMTMDGNKDFVWYTDPTDSHNFSALDNEVMRLAANGTFTLVGQATMAGLVTTGTVAVGSGSSYVDITGGGIRLGKVSTITATGESIAIEGAASDGSLTILGTADGKSFAHGSGGIASNGSFSAVGGKALGADTVAFGVDATANAVDSFVFAPYKSGAYSDHGSGTFNVSPLGGTDGFYIGETNITTTIYNLGDPRWTTPEDVTNIVTDLSTSGIIYYLAGNTASDIAGWRLLTTDYNEADGAEHNEGGAFTNNQYIANYISEAGVNIPDIQVGEITTHAHVSFVDQGGPSTVSLKMELYKLEQDGTIVAELEDTPAKLLVSAAGASLEYNWDIVATTLADMDGYRLGVRLKIINAIVVGADTVTVDTEGTTISRTSVPVNVGSLTAENIAQTNLTAFASSNVQGALDELAGPTNTTTTTFAQGIQLGTTNTASHGINTAPVTGQMLTTLYTHDTANEAGIGIHRTFNYSQDQSDGVDYSRANDNSVIITGTLSGSGSPDIKDITGSFISMEDNQSYSTSGARSRHVGQEIFFTGSPTLTDVGGLIHYGIQVTDEVNIGTDGSTLKAANRTVVSGTSDISYGYYSDVSGATASYAFYAFCGDSYFMDTEIDGALTQSELSADPADPAEGDSVQWQSDGTGSGDDGDIMVKITAGGVTKTITLIDFSAF